MKKTLLIAAAAIAATISSCASQQGKETDEPGSYSGKAPKYIFYFVGDGMSQPQISMAEKAINTPEFRDQFNKLTCNIYNIQENYKLNLHQFTSTGWATTNAENRYITCSAAAATALATGHKTTINTISKNGERTENLKTVAEMARDNGYKVGVISSVSIDHATPACFYAHEDDRNNYENIGQWLLKSNYDFFGGGCVRWDYYKDITKEQYFDSLKSLGYTVTSTKQDFNAVNSSTKKAFCTVGKNIEKMHDSGSLPYNIDLSAQNSDDDRIVLKDFVKKAIEVLDNEKGFFLFTEGGKIDWSDHANDAVSNVYETIALDAAIGVAMEFYKQHPDETMIVFTGDHECGGLTLGYAGTHYESAFALMSHQRTSFQEFSEMMWEYAKTKPSFKDVMDKVTESFGLTTEGDGELKLSELETKRLKEAYEQSLNPDKSKLLKEESYLYYGGYEPITVTTTHILDNKAGVDWASFSHTALPVPVYSMGCGSKLLIGYFDNTDVPNTIIKVAKLK